MLLNAAREHLAFLRANASHPELRSNERDPLGATTARLKALGLSARQIERLPETFSETNLFFEILSPLAGTVVSKSVYEGQTVKEGERLLEFADFSTMWFKFDAYERDLAALSTGQSVELASAALPGRILMGRVTFIDPNFDEKTRATKVRVEIPNPLVETNGAMRREISHRLFAEARVASVVPDVLAIPRGSVLNPGGAPFVFVEKSAGAYERRPVTVGRSGDDLVEVLSGVAAGEHVVTSGNLLIDSQSQLDSGSAMRVQPSTPTTVAPPDAAGQDALRKVFALAAGLAETLAADDLNAFQNRSAELHSVMPAAAEAMTGTAGWSAHIEAANRAAHFAPPGDLTAARARFHEFITPVVELAKLARAGDSKSAPRIFQCPMTKTIFPNAPTNAFWLQLGGGGIRNPYFGAAMIDCGTEVKP
jgi:Cu(I)/Ag(I) efflux system membrane fusion protein